MACEACDHTIQRVNEGINPKVFWCPRCGTIKSKDRVPEYVNPKIVDYATALCVAVDNGLDYEQVLAPLVATVSKSCGLILCRHLARGEREKGQDK